MKQFLTPAFLVTLLMLGLVGYVVMKVFEAGTTVSDDVQTMVITAVVIATLQELRKFWLNSTADSEAKNSTIAQQARTAAAAQDALLDPDTIVTVGKKAESALLPQQPAEPKP